MPKSTEGAIGWILLFGRCTVAIVRSLGGFDFTYVSSNRWWWKAVWYRWGRQYAWFTSVTEINVFGCEHQQK